MIYSRPSILSATAAATLLGTVGARAQDVCEVITAERQKATTPQAALTALREGNQRFVAGKSVNFDLRQHVKGTASGQCPIAAAVGCIDSRVPPEIVFDQKIGDTFAARIAGNFANLDVNGSLEFACKVAGAKAIVVLRHSKCGAVKGAIDQAKLGNLTLMLEKIEPAIAATQITGERRSKDNKLVQAAADTNAKLAAKTILERSDVLREMAEKDEIIVGAAMHDISTGRVQFFS